MSQVRMTVAALVVAAGFAAPAGATTVTGPGQSGWLTKVTSPSGAVTWTDTLAATGTGSVNLTTGTDGDWNAELRSTAYNGLLLSDLDALTYETYGTAWNGQQLPYIALMVDTDGDGDADDQLQFEPGFQTVLSGNPALPDQGDGMLGGWQQWDARAGGWYGMDTTNFNLSFASPGTGVQSLDDYLLLNPTAKLATDPEGALRIQVGWASAGDVFDANVDDVIVDWGTVDAYDFERATGNTTQTVGPNGGTVTSDEDADGATNADPVEVAVTTTGTGTVSVTKDAGTGAASGFSLLGEHLTITAPAQSDTDPLIFTLRAQLPSPYPASEVDVFRNGVKIDDCTDPTPGADADPDPCIESRGTNGDDAEIVVRSSAASDWAIELPKPVVVLDSVPADPTNDTTPNYTFHTEIDGTTVSATVSCSITGVAAATCTSPKAFTLPGPAYVQGSKTASFTATFAGITGAATTDSFVLDTIAPTMAITLMTPHGHTVNQTNTATPSFHFTSSENATFECKVDGGVYAACDSPGLGTSGDHVVAAQTEGLHTLSVRGTDPATNQGVATFVFGVDLTLPDAEATVADGDEYVLHQDKTITCTDPLGNSYASGVYTCVATIDGVPGFSLDTHSDDFGYHSFTSTATDEAGNVDATGTVHYVVNAGTYEDAVQGYNPKGYWRLNQGQGSSTMSDSSGNNKNGKYANGVGLPRTGPVIDETTNGDAGAAEMGGKAYGYANEIYAPQTAYTMDAWVQPSSVEAMSVLSHGAGAGEVYVNGDGRFAFRHVDTTIVDSSTDVVAGDWYHVQAVWSRPLAFNPGTMTLRVERFDSSLVTTSSNAVTGSSSRDASGKSTFYVGFGEQTAAQAFKGLMSEVAYIGSALSAHDFADLTETMRWTRRPIRPGANFAKPSITISNPLDGDGYQTSKAPVSGPISFSCSDPADDGNEGLSCTATLDGNPVNQGDPLPALAGSHTLTVTADDGAGDPVTESVTFNVGTYSSVINQDSPTAYWRLDEPTGATTMVDQTGDYSGAYKWDPKDSLALVNGGTGISGDLNTTREWLGRGAYAYVNGLPAPADGSTVEAWVKLDNVARDQMILQHGGGTTLSVEGSTFVYRPNGNVATSVSGGSPSTTDFRQVVGTYDGVVARLYVDGVLVGAVAAPTPAPAGKATFYLGRGDLALPDLHGKLDEVAYFPSALSARRVWLHFKADPPPGPTYSDSSSSAGGAKGASKAKARAKVKQATRALTKAKAKLKYLRKHHASRAAVRRARAAVKVRTKALAKVRRTLRRA